MQPSNPDADRGPHAREKEVLAYTLLLGGTFVAHNRDLMRWWCVQWDGGYTGFYGSRYRAGLDYLRMLGYDVAVNGELFKL
jgi:hypothetical protein